MRLLAVAMLFMSLCCRGQDLLVEALLPGVAVLQIDGARVTLRAGQSEGSVKLISSDSREALIEVDGVTRRLTVSERITAQFARPARRSVAVPIDERLQYRVTAEVNGVRLPVIVDTGANVVALNSRHARAVGLTPGAGQPMQVQTAGALMPARRVTLESVDIGGILVKRVDATVLEGDFPEVILLGMSFLKHVELEDRGGVLTLTAPW